MNSFRVRTDSGEEIVIRVVPPPVHEINSQDGPAYVRDRRTFLVTEDGDDVSGMGNGRYLIRRGSDFIEATKIDD